MEVSGLGIMMFGVASLFMGWGKIIGETEHELNYDGNQTRLKKYGSNMHNLGKRLFKTALATELLFTIGKVLDPFIDDFVYSYLGMSSDEFSCLFRIFVLAQIIYMMD